MLNVINGFAYKCALVVDLKKILENACTKLDINGRIILVRYN
jgi:hypothetical protein